MSLSQTAFNINKGDDITDHCASELFIFMVSKYVYELHFP